MYCRRKDLTQEESNNILKEFLDSAYSNIKGDIELRARFDAILGKIKSNFNLYRSVALLILDI